MNTSLACPSLKYVHCMSDAPYLGPYKYDTKRVKKKCINTTMCAMAKLENAHSSEASQAINKLSESESHVIWLSQLAKMSSMQKHSLRWYSNTFWLSPRQLNYYISSSRSLPTTAHLYPVEKATTSTAKCLSKISTKSDTDQRIENSCYAPAAHQKNKQSHSRCRHQNARKLIPVEDQRHIGRERDEEGQQEGHQRHGGHDVDPAAPAGQDAHRPTAGGRC